MPHCEKCNVIFKTAYGLERHLNRKNPCDINGVKYVCETCGYTTANKKKFTHHINRKMPCVKLFLSVLANDHLG